MKVPNVVEPKDAEYPHVPTPKEHELSRHVVDLQQEKDAIEHKLMAQIKDLESQIHKLQVRVHDLSQQLQATKREQVQAEQLAIENERDVWKERVSALEHELDMEKNDKEAQKKWRVKFSVTDTATVVDDESIVDPVDDALAKFAQSIALLPAKAAPKATQAGVLPFLVHLLREHFSDVVTGSALLALVHLSIHQKPQRIKRFGNPLVSSETGSCVKEEIVKAGVAAPLAHILETVRNPRVLVEASRLCAALSTYVPNKRVLAAKNIVRFLIRLLVPHVDDDSSGDGIDTSRLERIPLPGSADLQRFALVALVNLSHDSEVLRSQIVNYHFIPIAVRYVRESEHILVQAEAAKLLGNLAYNHVVNQSAIMTAEGDTWLTRRLTPDTMARSSVLVRASAIGVGNLAYTSVNQLSIGYGEAMTHLLQLLVDSTDPLVLDATAAAISGLCHTSPLNKSRAIAQNGLQVLLYVISRSGRYGHDEDVLVSALECLAILARPKTARQQLMEIDGHLPICHLCKKATHESVLRASAMVLCVLIPTPIERHVLLTDSKEAKLETNNIGLAALERVRHTLFTGADPPKPVPTWLSHGLSLLTTYSTTAGKTSAAPTCDATADDDSEAMEFFDRSYYSLESLTEIEPDELCPDFYGDVERTTKRKTKTKRT